MMGDQGAGEGARNSALRRVILDRFDRERRPLPWRDGRTPYRVLVSEMMLQQTRAGVVANYYRRWIRRFPDWVTLAGATRDEVLMAWKGLGYYARAVNLHRIAVLVCERHGGRLPEDPVRLRALPGVGEYTAGAVASIAFGQVVPAVDGNARRVLARVFDMDQPTPSQLRRVATDLIDPARPGDFNEALMELGATLCTHRVPGCARCPVGVLCWARTRGTVELRPAPRPRPRVRAVGIASLVAVVAADSVPLTLLVRRPPGGLLAHMWEFPSCELPVDSSARVADAAIRELLARCGLDGAARVPMNPVAHAFTHLRATYHPVLVPVVGVEAKAGERVRGLGHANGAVWAEVGELADWPLPVAQQKIAGQLYERLSDARDRQSGR